MTAPKLVGVAPILAESVTRGTPYFYLADGLAGVQILDANDPANIALVTSDDAPGHAFRIRVAGLHAYVADGEGGVLVLDASDPTSSVLLGHLPIDGSADAADLQGRPRRRVSVALTRLNLSCACTPSRPPAP